MLQDTNSKSAGDYGSNIPTDQQYDIIICIYLALRKLKRTAHLDNMIQKLGWYIFYRHMLNLRNAYAKGQCMTAVCCYQGIKIP